MDTEYRTMYNVFDGAVYEDFVFYCTRKQSPVGKLASGAYRSMQFDAPKRTVSQSLIQTLSRKTGNLYVISNGRQVKLVEV